MAENLLTRCPLLTRQVQRDIEFATDHPFSPLLALERVVRAMEEVPAAYADALRILKGPPYTPPADQPD
jgi:hypothetical protein